MTVGPSFAAFHAAAERLASATTFDDVSDRVASGLVSALGATRAECYLIESPGGDAPVLAEAAREENAATASEGGSQRAVPLGAGWIRRLREAMSLASTRVFTRDDLVAVGPHDWPSVLDDRDATVTVAAVATGVTEVVVLCWLRTSPPDAWLDALSAFAVIAGLSVTKLEQTRARDRARIEADAQIARLSRQQDLLLASAAEGICGLDRDGQVVFVNPAAARLLGYDVADLVRKSLHELVHFAQEDGSPYPRAECPIVAALRDGAIHRVTGEVFWRRDGTSFPVDYVSAPTRDHDAIVGAVVVFTDTTERRRSEAIHARLLLEAEAAERRYRGFLESAPDAIVVVSDQGTIVFANHQTEIMFGYDRDALVGQSLELLVPERLRETHRRHRAIYNADPHTRPMGIGLDLIGRRGDGSEFPVEISLSPAEEGGRRTVTSVIRDISERKRLVEAERRARADVERQKDEFLANVSHDLRTPLTAIKASIGVVLANEPAGTPEPLHRLFVNIELAADRMATLVSDLLELTRLQSGRAPFRPIWCNLNDVARRSARAIEPLLQLKSQRLQLDLPTEPVFTRADPDRLERALLNLLSNAQKYGQTRGSIQFGLKSRTEEAIFTVMDDGPGIAPDEQRHIFERFYRSETEATRNRQGSGLGLPIARAMVELHGGRIWVQSTLGLGTTFSVALPVVAPDLAPIPEEANR